MHGTMKLYPRNTFGGPQPGKPIKPTSGVVTDSLGFYRDCGGLQ